MGYPNLSACIEDLRITGRLRVIEHPIDPRLEMAHIQRRAFRAGAPALLFARPKNCRFPMLANLFGTKERLEYIFRDSIKAINAIFRAKARPKFFLREPFSAFGALRALVHAPCAKTKKAPVLANKCSLANLPQLISWPGDGGAFITLPIVHSRDPETSADNLGMYRVQISGNDYLEDEAGMHYQLQRGIGVHHAKALEKGLELPAHVYAGGPPALSVAAVMPLPEGMSELLFAGLLGGRRVRLCQAQGFALPVLAECDFLLQGKIANNLKPEGPFGDHLGYYSLRHDFPVLKVESVWHRDGAVWPFTSVGRPPQEDTIFGDFIHDLTGPLVGNVFEGVREVHAVDAAGVHPLLLAMGSERYTAYEARRKPRELLTQAMHLLGTTQTALAKFLLIAAAEDAPGLSIRDVGGFLRHMLERADFSRDLHFITRSACDTLDYTGTALHEGSRLIWASAGEKRRALASEISGLPALPAGCRKPLAAAPGIMVLEGPAHRAERGVQDEYIAKDLCHCLEAWPQKDNFPLVVVTDDSAFCAASLDNFLWTTFTRADPATDSYGPNSSIQSKHWSCGTPFILDARRKAFHAPPLEDDPEIAARVEKLAARGGPLEGLF